MSDYDPNRMDPTRPDPRDARNETGSDFNWNWVIGGLAALVMLIVALSFVGRRDQTADSGQPAATTGQATTPPAIRSDREPVMPNAAPNAMTPDWPMPRPATPNQ